MVNRAFLDKQLVDSAVVPDKGEAWIADTKVKGFGLRLYNTSDGPKKAYAVRTTTANGKSVRRSFDLNAARFDAYSQWNLSAYDGNQWSDFSWDAGEGRYAEVARHWAVKEIRTLKGLPTTESENAERKERARSLVRDITLERAAQAVIANYKRMKLSTAYVDKLDKLFTNLIPAALREKSMAQLSIEDACDIHAAIDHKPGNRQTIQPFIGKVFQLYQSIAGGSDKFALARGFEPEMGTSPAKSFAIDDSNAGKIRNLIELLETEDRYWQQALCLRFYLSMHAPLNQLMAARWDQLYELTNRNTKQTFLQWRYRDTRRSYESLRGNLEKLIETLSDKGLSEFGENDYWFPSRFGRKVSHIRTVDGTWHRMLHEVALPYVSPRSMRSAIVQFGSWRILDDKNVQFSRSIVPPNAE